MRAILIGSVVLGVLLQVGPADALTPREAALLVERQGYAVEPGAGVAEGTLTQVVRDAQSVGVHLLPVFLAEGASVDPVAFADDVLDLVGGGTAVVFIGDEDVAASSTQFGDDEVQAALEEAGDELFTDPVGGLGQFSAALARDPAVASSARPWLVLIAVLAVVGVFTLVSSARTRRRYAQRRAAKLAEARAELSAHVSAMADAILDLSDRVAVSGHPDAQRALAEASVTYSEALGGLDQELTGEQLTALHERVDRGRWQLEVARALAEGLEAPPEPSERSACFFDPTHGGGTEEAQLQTAAGARPVRVCSYCAEKLRRGQQPQPRMVPVDGRSLPAPMAPPTHGGTGLDWLRDFTVILGGGRSGPYDWGGYHPRRRGGFRTGGSLSAGGVFGRGRGSLSRGSGGSARGRGRVSRRGSRGGGRLSR